MPSQETGRSRQLYQELHAEVEQRKDSEVIDTIQMMADLYENKLPGKFDKYFPSGSPKHVVGLVKLAWNDLATTVGRIPDLRMDALNESDAEEKRVGKSERIAHSYLRNAEPTGKTFMWLLGWWLVGTGRAVAIVKPGYDSQGQPAPQFTIRDPRESFPNMRTINNIPVEIYDILFEYEIPLKVAQKMGLAEENDDRLQMPSPYSGDGLKVKVVEFIDDDQWVLVSEQGYFQREVHGLGKTPAWVFQSFAPNAEAGLSLFKDQITFQVAISQLLTLKLAAADRNVNPVYFAKGHVGTIKIGPNVINKLTASGEIGSLPPPQLVQVDRDIDQLIQLSRVLNRNPEVRQGEVQGKGNYISAKTLEQLSEAIDTVVGQYWDIVSTGLQWLFHVAYKMDEMNWPDIERTITTNVKNRFKRDNYKPAKDINGRYYINVDYGFGLGGYQGFLQNLQANAAKVLSRKRVMEDMPGVSDVDKEMRQIELEDMDAAGNAAFQAQAASGQLDSVMWAKMRTLMAEDGLSLHEVIVNMEEELQQQAAQSVQQGGADALTAAPAPQEPVAEEAPLPALPPAALV